MDLQELRARIQKRLQERDTENQPRPDESIRFVGEFVSNPDATLCPGQIVAMMPRASEARCAGIASKISSKAIHLDLPWSGSGFQIGEFVQVEYWNPKNVYSFDSKILGVNPSKKQLEISRPKIGIASRRKRSRKPVSFCFTVLDASTSDLIGKAASNQRAQDLGLDGLVFQTALPLKLGDKLKIELFLPEKTIAVGSVAGERTLTAKESFSVVVKFVKLEAADQNRLMLFVAKTRAYQLGAEYFLG